MPVTVHRLSPAEAAAAAESGGAVLVDVRERFERAGGRVPGSHHAPLLRLDPATLRAAHPGRRIVFHCCSGHRSAAAARRFAAATGEAEALSLDGGVLAWKRAGLPMETPEPGASPPHGVSLLRQVHLTAGGATLLGTALGWFVAPAFFAVPALIGAGLLFAGASGWCGMAKLLARMPWNAGTT